MLMIMINDSTHKIIIDSFFLKKHYLLKVLNKMLIHISDPNNNISPIAKAIRGNGIRAEIYHQLNRSPAVKVL